MYEFGKGTQFDSQQHETIYKDLVIVMKRAILDAS